MKIKVFVKHFSYVKDVVVKKQYDYDDEFIFLFRDGYVFKDTWKKPANDLMEAFTAIKQYFSGVNYDIVDFAQMVE